MATKDNGNLQGEAIEKTAWAHTVSICDAIGYSLFVLIRGKNPRTKYNPEIFNYTFILQSKSALKVSLRL